MCINRCLPLVWEPVNQVFSDPFSKKCSYQSYTIFWGVFSIVYKLRSWPNFLLKKKEQSIYRFCEVLNSTGARLKFRLPVSDTCTLTLKVASEKTDNNFAFIFLQFSHKNPPIYHARQIYSSLIHMICDISFLKNI